MPWFDDGEEPATRARFQDVTPRHRADLSWAGAAAAETFSLKPPRIPVIGQPADAGASLPPEPEPAHSERPPVPSVAPPSLEVAAMPHSSAALEPVIEPVRRVDTMIDELLSPRAEDDAIAAIRTAVEQAVRDREVKAAAAEQNMVDLAILIARRVIAREVSTDPSIVRGLVREGIRALGEQERIVVRLGTFFTNMREEIRAELRGSKIQIEVLVDPALGETGCVVETSLGHVDESIDERLSNVIDAILQR